MWTFFTCDYSIHFETILIMWISEKTMVTYSTVFSVVAAQAEQLIGFQCQEITADVTLQTT